MNFNPPYSSPQRNSKLLTIGNVIFLLVLVMLSCYNRWAVDDYFNWSVVRSEGIFGSVRYFYENASGRLGSVFLVSLLTWLASHGTLFLTLCTLFFLAAFIFSIYAFFKALFPELSSGNRINLSILFFQIFYLMVPGKGEIFFWQNAVSIYGFWLVWLLLLASELLKEKPQLGVITIWVIVLASGPESFGLISGILLLLAYKKIGGGKVLLPLGLLIIVYLRCALAPGNFKRMNWLEEPSILRTLKLSAGFGFFLIKKSFLGILWILPVCLVLMEVTSLRINTIKPFKIMAIIAGLILSDFFIIYTVSDYPPARAQGVIWLFVSLLIVVLLFNLKWKLPASFLLGRAAIFILPIFWLCYGLIKVPKARSYALSVDDRTELLLQQKKNGRTDALKLSPLKDSGDLFSAEISTDSTHFSNKHLKRGLQLGFDIYR